MKTTHECINTFRCPPPGLLRARVLNNVNVKWLFLCFYECCRATRYHWKQLSYSVSIYSDFSNLTHPHTNTHLMVWKARLFQLILPWPVRSDVWQTHMPLWYYMARLTWHLPLDMWWDPRESMMINMAH